VTRRVTRGGDDPQIEHAVTVAHRRERPRDADPRDVRCARVTHRVGRRRKDGRRAADVVAVEVREDDMAHGVPAQASRTEGCLDVVLAAGDAGIDDGGFAGPDENVGRHEAEIDPMPGDASGGRDVGRGAGWIGRRGRVRRARRQGQWVRRRGGGSRRR